jgi:hypothetical protein
MIIPTTHTALLSLSSLPVDVVALSGGLKLRLPSCGRRYAPRGGHAYHAGEHDLPLFEMLLLPSSLTHKALHNQSTLTQLHHIYSSHTHMLTQTHTLPHTHRRALTQAGHTHSGAKIAYDQELLGHRGERAAR